MKPIALHCLVALALLANGLTLRAEKMTSCISAWEVEGRYIPLAAQFRQEIERQVEVDVSEPVRPPAQTPLNRVEALVPWTDLFLRSQCHIYAFMSLQL